LTLERRALGCERQVECRPLTGEVLRQLPLGLPQDRVLWRPRLVLPAELDQSQRLVGRRESEAADRRVDDGGVGGGHGGDLPVVVGIAVAEVYCRTVLAGE